MDIHVRACVQTQSVHHQRAHIYNQSRTPRLDFWPARGAATTLRRSYDSSTGCPYVNGSLSRSQFKRLLKTYLFGGWDRGALWHLLGAPCINYLTYLLTYLHMISDGHATDQSQHRWCPGQSQTKFASSVFAGRRCHESFFHTRIAI